MVGVPESVRVMLKGEPISRNASILVATWAAVSWNTGGALSERRTKPSTPSRHSSWTGCRLAMMLAAVSHTASVSNPADGAGPNVLVVAITNASAAVMRCCSA